MKITNVEMITLRGPELPRPAHPSWAPGNAITHWGGGIVKISTDEGLVGIGTPGYGAAANFETWIKPQLIGMSPFATERVAQILRQANGGWGIEIAIWDLIGKATGQPLYKLWGGYQDKVPAYASFIEVRSPEQRAEDVQRVRDEGYRAAKLRLHDWTMKEDLAQVTAARRAVGDDFVLLADANQAQQPGTPHRELSPVWTEQRAVQTARELERLGFYWLEEPLDRYNYEGLSRLCAAVDILIAGGENNRGLHEFRQLIEENCYDVIQPEALVSEGIGQLRKVASLAELHHKLVAPHHGGGGVGLAAHLHLCAAIPNASYLEVWHDAPCMTSDIFQWYLKEPLKIDAEGYVHVPQKPGLGVELDEDKIKSFG